MKTRKNDLFEQITSILGKDLERCAKAKEVAEAIRCEGPYRWTGIYDVDMDAGTVSNIAWSGAAAPTYPTFPITQGLTSRAIAARATVNVGDVTKDEDYLEALPTTRSEIIVPVHGPGGKVIGTIDIESEESNAFGFETQTMLEECSRLLSTFWADRYR